MEGDVQNTEKVGESFFIFDSRIVGGGIGMIFYGIPKLFPLIVSRPLRQCSISVWKWESWSCIYKV